MTTLMGEDIVVNNIIYFHAPTAIRAADKPRREFDCLMTTKQGMNTGFQSCNHGGLYMF